MKGGREKNRSRATVRGTKKWSLVALNGIHSVFAMRERGGERGAGGREAGEAVLRILFAVVTPRLLQLPPSSVRPVRVRRVVRLRSAMLDEGTDRLGIDECE